MFDFPTDSRFLSGCGGLVGYPSYGLYSFSPSWVFGFFLLSDSSFFFFPGGLEGVFSFREVADFFLGKLSLNPVSRC